MGGEGYGFKEKSYWCKDSFAEAMKSLEESHASLHINDAQLGEAIENFQSQEGKYVSEAREMWLQSAKLANVSMPRRRKVRD